MKERVSQKRQWCCEGTDAVAGTREGITNNKDPREEWTVDGAKTKEESQRVQQYMSADHPGRENYLRRAADCCREQ